MFCLDEELFLGAGGGPGRKTNTQSSPETRYLVNKLRNWLTKSRAPNTFKKYRTPWRRWLEWAVTRSKRGEWTPLLPAEPFHVALFLVHLAETFKGAKTVVESAVTALNFVHRLNGHPEPYNHLTRAVNEGVRRERGCPAKKARPLTVPMLRLIVRGWGQKKCPLWQRMMATMILLGFVTFGRLGEISKIRGGDVHFRKDHLRIFIERSKTDQSRKGAWIIVAETRTELCPVRHMKNLLRMIKPRLHDPVFRTIWKRSVKSMGSESLGTASISSSTYHRYFRRALTELCHMTTSQSNDFSGHSMRRGGATAAELAQIPARLRMRHGRWVSVKTADDYIGDPRNEILAVTRGLGL